MKYLKLLPLLLLLTNYSFSQIKADTIITKSNEKLVVFIQETNEQNITFIYPNESVINKMSLNNISQILYSSGRIQSLTSNYEYPKIHSAVEWMNISVVEDNSAIKGLNEVDVIVTNRTGKTLFTDATKNKNIAYNKLKMVAALIGANVVYLKNESSGLAYTPGGVISYAPKTNSLFSGIAYTSNKLDFDMIKEFLNLNRKFNYLQLHIMGTDDDRISFRDRSFSDVILNNPKQGKFYVTVESNLKGNSLREYNIVYCNNDSIVLMDRTNSHIWNYILKASK